MDVIGQPMPTGSVLADPQANEFCVLTPRCKRRPIAG